MPAWFRHHSTKPDAQSAFPEVIKGDERYVVAIPGQPFEVRVAAPPSMLRGQDFVQVVLRLDGVTLGVAAMLNLRSPKYTFHGWVNTVKGQSQYLQFNFGNAQLDTGISASNQSAGAPAGTGVVTATFRSAKQTHIPVGPAHDYSAPAAGKHGLKEGAHLGLHGASGARSLALALAFLRAVFKTPLNWQQHYLVVASCPAPMSCSDSARVSCFGNNPAVAEHLSLWHPVVHSSTWQCQAYRGLAVLCLHLMISGC